MQRTYEVCETNGKGEPIPVYADRLSNGERCEVKNGDRFTAELDTEKHWDKRGKEPVQVDTKREFVVSSDIDVHPGCLTSMIRTGRARPVKEQPKQVAAKK